MASARSKAAETIRFSIDPAVGTAAFSNTVAARCSAATPAMTGTTVPTTILRGDPTFPFLVGAVERLAAAMPDAELVVVPESHDHGVDPEATARLVASRLQHA